VRGIFYIMGQKKKISRRNYSQAKDVKDFWKKICLHKKKEMNPSPPDDQGVRILFQKIKCLHLCKLEIILPICKVIFHVLLPRIIAPMKDTYPLENGVRVAPLQKFIDFLESLKH